MLFAVVVVVVFGYQVPRESQWERGGEWRGKDLALPTPVGLRAPRESRKQIASNKPTGESANRLHFQVEVSFLVISKVPFSFEAVWTVLSFVCQTKNLVLETPHSASQHR